MRSGKASQVGCWVPSSAPLSVGLCALYVPAWRCDCTAATLARLLVGCVSQQVHSRNTGVFAAAAVGRQLALPAMHLPNLSCSCPFVAGRLSSSWTPNLAPNGRLCPSPLCLAGAALAGLLEAHPNLLTYTVSADGKQLEKGQARASVDVSERHGAKVAGVSYWREGASFQTAPVAPLKPSAL